MTSLSRPTRILLATDMSARSDRALERAALLSKDWDAGLAIVYAVEAIDSGRNIVPSWRRKENAQEIFKQKMQHDLQLDGLGHAPLYIENGTPEEVILSVSKREQSDLIVTGMARYEPFGRIQVGNTTNSLVRHAAMPVLVVKNRPRRPYDKIVVATDLSDASKKALQLAFKLFAPEKISVFYAYSAAYADMMDEKEEYVTGVGKDKKDMLQKFLDEVIGTDLAQKATLMVEYGSPADLLTQYVVDHEVDLVISGTHGRTGLSSILLGSVAEAILGMVPTDILIARG